MKYKLIIAGIAAAAAVALIASPAMATTGFGDLQTINATGGTGMTDGLKIDIASGQIQVLRDGLGQFYGPESLPNVDPTATDMNNFYSVSYNDGSNMTIGPADNSLPTGYVYDYNWVSGTSSETLSSDGKSGTVVNTLTSDETGHGVVTLEITYVYTYPNQFVNISTNLTLPTGWNYPTRLHWNTDATLGGADNGNQFDGTLTSGQFVRGVVSPDGSQIEAFRQVSGQNVNSWAAEYYCPWLADNGPACDTSLTNSWIFSNSDAPNMTSTETDIDNGFGISVPAVSAAGSHTASWDVLFASCLDGIPALQCITDGDNAAAAAIAAEDTAAAEAATLAHTGINAVQGGFLAGGGALLALVGAGLVIARRRKVNN